MYIKIKIYTKRNSHVRNSSAVMLLYRLLLERFLDTIACT